MNRPGQLQILVCRTVLHNVVILSEQRESKDLRTNFTLYINEMRRFFDSAGATLRMTYLGVRQCDKLQFLFQSTQVQTSGASAGVEGHGIIAGGDDLVHLPGILGGEIQPCGPKT